MLYALYLWLKSIGSVGALNILRYPTFRTLLSGIVAVGLGLLIGPWLIRKLRVNQHGASNIREDTPDQHQKKKGTPTMGGALMLFAVAASILLCGNLEADGVWFVLTICFGYGFIGYLDDWLKVSKRNSKGLNGRYKMVLQTVFYALALAVFLTEWRDGVATLKLDSRLAIPFVPSHWLHPDLGVFYPFFGWLVVVGTSNAVNITDGLDGLATFPTILAASTFGILAYLGGTELSIAQLNPNGSGLTGVPLHEYLGIPRVDGGAELAVLCASLAGAGIAFLWFNAYPASVFMGDVGSLALGGALGALAVVTKNELLSLLVHLIFLIEIMSVILQVLSFQMTGKRIFKMAPVHHHFELKGLAEPKIIVRFWIISLMCCGLALLSLKVR